MTNTNNTINALTIGASVVLHVWNGNGFQVVEGTVDDVWVNEDGETVLSIAEDDSRIYGINQVHTAL